MDEIGESQVNTRGFKVCPTCHQIMGESVDHKGDSYYVCPCGNKIRIFHRPIRIEKPFDGVGVA